MNNFAADCKMTVRTVPATNSDEDQRFLNPPDVRVCVSTNLMNALSREEFTGCHKASYLLDLILFYIAYILRSDALNVALFKIRVKLYLGICEMKLYQTLYVRLLW